MKFYVAVLCRWEKSTVHYECTECITPVDYVELVKLVLNGTLICCIEY